MRACVPARIGGGKAFETYLATDVAHTALLCRGRRSQRFFENNFENHSDTHLKNETQIESPGYLPVTYECPYSDLAAWMNTCLINLPRLPLNFPCA